MTDDSSSRDPSELTLAPTESRAEGMDELIQQAIQAAEARGNDASPESLLSDRSNPASLPPKTSPSALPGRVSPLSTSSSPSHNIRSQGSPVSVGSAYSPANSTVFTRSPYHTSRTSPYQRHLSPGADGGQTYAYHNRFYQPQYQYPPMADPAFLYSQYPNQPSAYASYGYGSPHAPSPYAFYQAQLPPTNFQNSGYFQRENAESQEEAGYEQPQNADELYSSQESESFNAGYATALLHQSQPSSSNFQPRGMVGPDPSESVLYSPMAPPTLERGHLAQANLHNAVYGRPAPLAHQYPEQQHRRKQNGPNSALPTPPPHSDFALWIGNVPSDSSHNELWRFFNSRPSPASAGLEHGPDAPADAPDLGWTGVQSIHLIGRSNCCFVNYASQVHLDHAIKVSHGVSLRPFDLRVKPLVCRVRKREDDSRTGVGAQRGRGLHHQWAYEQAKAKKAAATPRPRGHEFEKRQEPTVFERDFAEDDPQKAEKPAEQPQTSSASTEISNASTSSSFLSRHFAKRYFILKSHTEEDLDLSLRQSVWATQSHNEPVLDQAYRTSRDGVFLIFSANKSGEFYGFAKMSGPITPDPNMSKSTVDSGSSVAAPSTSSEKPTDSEKPTLAILSTLGQLAASPSPLTPSQKSPEKEAYQAAALRSLIAVVQQRSEPTPTPAVTDVDTEDTLAARRGLSLDIDALANAKGGIRDLSLTKNAEEQTSEVAQAQIQADEHGVAKAAMTHNAKLDMIPDETEGTGAPQARNSSGSVDHAWGRPFRIQWIKVQRLQFNRTRHVRNSFNRNREVKISRDGTELDPMAGEMLLSLFFNQAPPPESPYSEQFSPPFMASR